MLEISILTLFPESLNAVLNKSIIGAAIKSGRLSVDCIQIREHTHDKQCRVDDYPYGGGMGMVMQADPLYNAWKSVIEKNGGKRLHTVLMSAQGKVYTQHDARRLSLYDKFIIVCGHYEGVDQRFIDECVDEEISIGDFVLTGGEIPALAIVDSVGRILPGVLADESCYTQESHWSGLLEHPHYTRPEIWRGISVPEVLLSGNRDNIKKWRRLLSLRLTQKRRPDLLKKLKLSQEDKGLLKENSRNFSDSDI